MKYIKFCLVIFIGLSFIIRISSCQHDPSLENVPELCFDADILPIFQNNCALSGCHIGSGELPAYTSYNSIMHDVVPGRPGSSKIYEVLIKTSGEEMMPPDQPLSIENRTMIRIWIEQGAQQTPCQGIVKK